MHLEAAAVKMYGRSTVAVVMINQGQQSRHPSKQRNGQTKMAAPLVIRYAAIPRDSTYSS